MPVLVVLCGPSQAGKSSFAEKLGSGFTIVSTDQIRSQLGVGFRPFRFEHRVWDIFEQAKCQALKEGRNVVLDGCHMSPQARWHAVQGPSSRHGKLLVLFDVPLELVLARCADTGRLPRSEVERVWRVFQSCKPTRAELQQLGFDWVYEVRC